MPKRRKTGEHRSGNRARAGQVRRLLEQIPPDLRNQAERQLGRTGPLAQPSGASNPRRLGGGITGPGGSRDRGMVFLDTQNAVLLQHAEVATMDAVRDGKLGGQIIYMTLSGRVNKTTDHVRAAFIFGPDGAAALITELLALADRFGAELLDDLTRRLTKLHQGKHVDLHFLRAAVEIAIESQEEDGPAVDVHTTP